MKNLNKNYLLIFLLIGFLLLINVAASAQLKVHFIDVGQGDSILIQSESNNVLIDGGDRWQKVKNKLVSYLNSQKVDSIDVLVSTHPHADHIGGLSAVLKNFEVKSVCDSGRVHTSKTYENYLTLIDELDIPYYNPRRGEVIKLEDITFKVLHPVEEVNQYSLNNSSLVLYLEYGDVSFLFPGDIEKKVEEEIISEDIDINSTVLKISHHGSKTSSSKKFRDEVKPEIGVIQVGEDNRFGHPDQVILDILKENNIEVYRTDKHGTIVISTDGFSYKVATESKISSAEKSKTYLLNINIATQKEFETLWGVGPVTAEKIINYREKQGPFESIEEIKKVDGIDEYKFNKWKDKITI